MKSGGRSKLEGKMSFLNVGLLGVWINNVMCRVEHQTAPLFTTQNLQLTIIEASYVHFKLHLIESISTFIIILT